jgi:hypothetical protein
MIKNNINYKNFFSSIQNFPLHSENQNETFGDTEIEYSIYKRTDVSNLKKVQGYLLLLKQRLRIPNKNNYVPGSSSISGYENYPAIIQNTIDLKINNNAKIKLTNLFPRTLNSNVTTNSSTQSGSSNAIAHQHTTGSSTSNVNTFGVGLSAGFFGELPLGALSLNYSHSWISGQSKSDTQSDSNSFEKQLGYSNSMSIKDWSAYSNVSNNNQSITWIWGQSYPWDVILYNYSTEGDNVTLPDFVKERLLSGDLLLPPSELSLFGLDFTSHAAWLIDFPDGISSDEILTLSHKTTNFTASHEKSEKTLSAKLQSINEASTAMYSSGPLNLSQYSLAPIEISSVEGIPSIGFKVNEFTYPPKTSSDNFKIVSSKNNLEVMGTGFDSIMTSSFKTIPVINLYFKIEDTSFDYSLIFIHWLEKGSGSCTLSWTVNGQYVGLINLNRQQNNENAENMDKVSLRNLNYSSCNYHDYLVVGLNHVEIRIEPTGKSTNHLYTLSSISIQ